MKHLLFETQQFIRVQYLKDILGRLQDEVGTIFEFLKKPDTQAQRMIGFWAGIRLLMPVVESTAKSVDKRPWELLEKDLHITAGSLVWQMFRHSLTHGDLINYAKYGNQKVGWGVLLVGQGHIIKNNHIGLDLFTLYDSLVEFLETEIAKNDTTVIEVNVGVNYTNPQRYIVDDFSKLM